MLIQNYGLFWREERIDWGAGKRKGTLPGYWRGGKWVEVEFRHQKGVYVLYDPNFRIVYVGQAGKQNQCLFDRLKQHRRDALAERWSMFSWFGTRPVVEKNDGTFELGDQVVKTDLPAVLNHIEAILIASCEPPLNRQGGRFGDAEQYLQRRFLEEG